MLCLVPEQARALRPEFIRLKESAELEWAARSLVILAVRLEAAGAPSAAAACVEIAASAGPELWRTVSLRISDRQRARSQRFDRMSGKRISLDRTR